MADGSQYSVAYIAESTYGSTPATPAFSAIRCTGVDLPITKEIFESNEIRSDRQRVDARHGGRLVAGTISCEASYGGHFDDFLEAALCGTWSTDVLKAGTTRRSFTIEEIYSDLENGNKYFLNTGCEIDGFTLSASAGGIVTCEFPIIGQNQTTSSSAIAGSSYGAANTTEVFDAFDGSMSEGGSTIATVTEFGLTLSNGMQPKRVIGTDLTRLPSIGRTTITGSLTAFFEDEALYSKFTNETESSLTITLTDAAGNDWIIDLSSVVYTNVSKPVAGDGPIVITMDYTAIYNASDASSIVITRTAA